jgi:hypothetical protein
MGDELYHLPKNGATVVYVMGSDLYAQVEMQHPGGGWSELMQYQTCSLGRGSVVKPFGDSTYLRDEEETKSEGYLTQDEIIERQQHEECPWRLDEPYWVRAVSGEEFSAIIREKRWKQYRYGEGINECLPELRAVAAMVESLLRDGFPVRVWCWESQ